VELQPTVAIDGVLDVLLTAASGTRTLGTINCTNDAMTSTDIPATTTTAVTAGTLDANCRVISLFS
jgi:hypothetical protein